MAQQKYKMLFLSLSLALLTITTLLISFWLLVPIFLEKPKFLVLVSDGHIQMHLAQKDVLAGFRARHIFNPVSHGHIAYRTDDLDTFKAHLEAQGVQYSDWGNAAVAGWRQIFFYDPDGNVIEVHQADE